jgi:hypothetical protein
MTEMPLESPVDDVAEQQADLVPDPSPDPDRTVTDLRWDADPADAAEQSAEVPIDEDEWR